MGGGRTSHSGPLANLWIPVTLPKHPKTGNTTSWEWDALFAHGMWP